MNNIEKMLQDYRETLNDGSIDCALNYYNTSSYINDVISEQADSMVDIYTSDLMEWASDNIYEIDEAIKELGWQGDFIQMIRMAQWLTYEQEIREDIMDMIKMCALLVLRDEDVEITDEGLDFVLDNLRDDYDRFDQIEYDAMDFVEIYKNEIC